MEIWEERPFGGNIYAHVNQNMDKTTKLKQLTLRIPESLHREFKVSTAKKGQSMGEVALELIRNYLRKDAEPM